MLLSLNSFSAISSYFLGGLSGSLSGWIGVRIVGTSSCFRNVYVVVVSGISWE